MLLDISQALWTVNVSQLQSKICAFKGRLLKLQHFILELFQTRDMHVFTGIVWLYLFK